MERRFFIQTKALDPSPCLTALENPAAGALVVFEGRVRNRHEGRDVDALTYEVFPEMAEAEGDRLAAEALARFGILDARAIHRAGTVGIGEAAVWVGVVSAHRQEAFLAARWLMDAIKERVPVWKKEFFSDGPAEWVRANAGSFGDAGVDPAAAAHYARQVGLPGIGAEGQRTLARASVLVIGAGGLGCPALQYLAAAGVGRLIVVDGDRVDPTNLHRQILFGASSLGRSKAEAAAERLRDLNPLCAVNPIAEAATPENLPTLLSGIDAVLDCTDAFEAKYAIHDHAWRAGVPLVQASIYQFDGQLQVFHPGRPEDGCYRCLWPEPPPPGAVCNCAEAGVLGVTPGLLGVLQATETLKLLLGWPEGLGADTLHVDVLSGRTLRVARRCREDCCCGGKHPWPDTATGILDHGSEARRLRRAAVTVDLREAGERAEAPAVIEGVVHVPQAEWPSIPERVAHRPVVLCCASGVRSRRCLEALGHPPGIYAWVRPIRAWAALAGAEEGA